MLAMLTEGLKEVSIIAFNELRTPVFNSFCLTGGGVSEPDDRYKPGIGRLAGARADTLSTAASGGLGA
jgi:hypothetical protein